MGGHGFLMGVNVVCGVAFGNQRLEIKNALCVGRHFYATVESYRLARAQGGLLEWDCIG